MTGQVGIDFGRKSAEKNTEGVCFIADSDKIFPQDISEENVIYAICKGVAKCLCVGHLIEEDSDKKKRQLYRESPKPSHHLRVKAIH